MAGLFPEPSTSYSMDGMAPVSGRMYDGGPRSYGDDPWQRRNIVGGGALNWLGATLADELAAYSNAQQAAAVLPATSSVPSFDFKLEIPEFPPAVFNLGDYSVPPAATYTSPAVAPTAPNTAVAGQQPPFQPPPVGRAQMPGGAGGGANLPAARLISHPLLNSLGRGCGHSDTAVVAPADGDLIYRKLGDWDRLPKAAGQHYHLTSDANKMPQWSPQGVAAAAGHMVDNDAKDEPSFVWEGVTATTTELTLNCRAMAVTSGVVTADAASFQTIEVTSDGWLEFASTPAGVGTEAKMVISHAAAGATDHTYTVDLSAIGGGTISISRDAKGHLTGVSYA